MTRKERNEMLKETRDVMDQYVGLALKEMANSSVVMEDEENLAVFKLFRLSKKMCDYAEFQAAQFDKIEDRIDELYNLVEKMSKKEAM